MKTKNNVLIIVGAAIGLIVLGAIGFFWLLIYWGIILSPFDTYVLENRALDYFSEKYDINRSSIKIVQNKGVKYKDAACWDGVCSNELIISYNSKEYTIQYNDEINTFGDNYQYQLIYDDFSKYLRKNFPNASQIEIRRLEEDVLQTAARYDGDIEHYIKNLTPIIYDYKRAWQNEKGLVTSVLLYDDEDKDAALSCQKFKNTFSNIYFSCSSGFTN